MTRYQIQDRWTITHISIEGSNNVRHYTELQGCIFFGWLGGKIWWFNKKNANMRRRGGKRENFNCTWEKMSFLKEGGKNAILGKYPPLHWAVLARYLSTYSQGKYKIGLVIKYPYPSGRDEDPVFGSRYG